MNQFSIKDIEAISGIKAQTLRVWEQRYGILIPKRKDSKHRIYDDNDLKNILCVAHLNQNGYKISRIARMTKEEIASLTLSHSLKDQSFNSIISQYIDAISNFDEGRFNNIYQSHSHIEFEKIVLHIFYPLLDYIGRSWIVDQLKPAQEHFASELISAKIDAEIQRLKRITTGDVTLLFLPKGEFHKLPLLYISYLFKKYNKRTVFLGADVDIETIQNYIEKRQVNNIHTHLITEFLEEAPEIFINKLLKICHKQNIIISGPATFNISTSHQRLTLLTSMESLINYIRN
jgi:DNA-binding transcriptional MerR regulator